MNENKETTKGTIRFAMAIIAIFLAHWLLLVCLGCGGVPRIKLEPRLIPTNKVQVVGDNLEIVVSSAKRKDQGDAMKDAESLARLKFAQYLGTPNIYGSRPREYQYDRDESGLLHIVTVRMVMDKQNKPWRF